MVLAGSDGGSRAGNVPLFAICALLVFSIQWACFVPSWLTHTERFFDLVGSATYLTVIAIAVLASPSIGSRSLALGSMVAIWALRLGTFLFARVLSAGQDRRFNVMKHRFAWFLMTWTLQGLWVLLTAGAALASITANDPKPFGWLGAIGSVIWTIGLIIEVVADNQKRRFRAVSGNRDQFICNGLWSWSQHPNYFGEIMLWVGIAVVAFPTLSGWQYATLISPVFVWLLLTRVSGIPMLDRTAEHRWGDDPEYRAWRDSTSTLFLRPPRES